MRRRERPFRLTCARVRATVRQACRRTALLVTCALVLAPATALAQEYEDPSAPSPAYSALIGIGATVSTLVYGPVKLAYALGGTVVSGLAFLFTLGDTEVARPIFKASTGGDFVVTPAHLEGRESLRFSGR